MRKVLVAAIVAAALLGAGWLGTSFVAPYEAEATPKPAATTVVKRKAPKPVRKKTWAEQASASCARALEDSRAVLRDSAFTTLDSRTESHAVLRLLRTLAYIDGRTLRQLKRLRPSPADRRRVTETLDLLAEARRGNLATIAGLEARWRPELLEQSGNRNMRLNAELRVLFLGLGATGCAAYLDPESY